MNDPRTSEQERSFALTVAQQNWDEANAAQDAEYVQHLIEQHDEQAFYAELANMVNVPGLGYC